MRRFLLLLLLLLPFALASACGNGDGRDQALTTRTVVPGLAGDSASSTPAPAPAVQLARVASGLTRPTYVTNAADGSGRLFVLEKKGTIRVIKDGQLAASPFLDITALVESGGNEQGLLGLAFHPHFSENGRFFVTYTAKDGANTLAAYVANGARTAGEPASARVLFAIPDKRSNHNGGMVAFGPDGYLYFGTGDGGGSGDPDRNGQNLNALLGKILRVDVDQGPAYGVPGDNPFVGRQGVRPEVWAYGLRNPWRFSFDRQTGDLWIADVGQNKWEEVDFQPAQDKGGANYGWNVVEGTHCFQPATGCPADGVTMPVYEYSHDSGGCSVTGGYVYRGKAIPALAGQYLFTDYCEGSLQALRSENGRWVAAALGKTSGSVSSFGEDEAGELYLVGDRDGSLYRLVPR